MGPPRRPKGNRGMSSLTKILKGVARFNWEQSGLSKKALPIFERRYKDMYYLATDKQKEEMKRGFE